MKPSPPEKSQFFELLNRAVRIDGPTSRGNKRSGDYSDKKTGLRLYFIINLL